MAPPPPSSNSNPSTTSKAGITVNSQGERVIPASVRADGSIRPERRVREGYRPPEDVEIYKNRNAEAWKNRGSGGVPGAEPVEKAAPGKTDASNKNAKRKAARKKAKEREKEGQDSMTTTAPAKETTAAPPETPAVKTEEEIAAEKEKQAKAIRKKIRQANELKTRKDGGESLLPEQLEKVIKLNELLRQLKSLGFDQ
jgi:partner of Y14 and mago protein